MVGSGYRRVAAGDFASVGLKIDGSVWTWGRDLYGQIGNGVAGAPISDQYSQPTPYNVQF
jgi:alpha-tubulin suppressor-like RCC1 family protein